MPNNVTINRENKSRLFSFIFGAEENKKHLLSLYNAVNGTDYTDIDALEVTTLSDIIYIRMKNDVSFIFDAYMNLYEHQSTFNPNMPLRGLMYFANLYSQFLSVSSKNIYGKALVKIPTPRYTVFYNGNDIHPDRMDLKLSDAFERKDDSGQYEWTATMLNINKGHNQKLLDKCRALFEYSDFVAKVKEYQKCMPIGAAVDKAVDYAISKDYLEGFFKKHKEGIMFSCLANEEHYKQGIKEDYILDAVQMMKNCGIEKDVIISQIVETCNLEEQHAIELVNSYWNGYWDPNWE